MLRVERHELGPRCYVLGRRVHECHAGLGLLALAGGLAATGVHLLRIAAGVATALAVWMLVKDWRDLFPSRRDTTAWHPWMHRRPRPLREARRAAWLPPLAGLGVAAIGLLNLASALTPELRDRLALVQLALHGEVPTIAHALVLPVGATLVVLGGYIARRRRRAWALGVALLVGAGALNLLKGLDVEEALACWTLAGLLVWARDAFHVLHEPGDLAAVLVRCAGAAVVAFAVALAAVAAASHWGSPGLTVNRAFRDVFAPLTLSGGPTTWREPFGWVPTGIALLWVGALAAVTYMLFRPLGSPRELPADGDRRLARQIVKEHGTDTLSFFKLRCDNHHLFDKAHRAVLAYRIEGGMLLMSGDPVGPADAIPSLMRDLCDFADARGLKIGVLGAGESFSELAAHAGLRSMYIGDEAIVDCQAFSLEGRAIRKVRQSVSRAERAGFSATLRSVADLGEEDLRELEGVSALWRAGVPERGFSMAIDSLRGDHLGDTSVVVAHDETGAARAYLHLVPCYRRSAMSLSAMPRDPDTPNGLMEFLVVRAIALLREEGINELSLNFAAFARVMNQPSGWGEAMLGRAVALGNPFFQIESLYRFNAKFSPRWEPRYLLYENAFALPRAGLAAMWAEGQLPRPRLRPLARAA